MELSVACLEGLWCGDTVPLAFISELDRGGWSASGPDLLTPGVSTYQIGGWVSPSSSLNSYEKGMVTVRVCR